MSRHRKPPRIVGLAVADGMLFCAAGLALVATQVAPHSAVAERFTTAPEASEPIAHGGPLAMPSIGWLPSEQTVATTTQNVPVIATSARRTASAPRTHVPTTPSVTLGASQGFSAGPTLEVTTSTPNPPVAAATSDSTAPTTVSSLSSATGLPPTTPSTDSSAATETTTPSPSATGTLGLPGLTTASSASTAPDLTAEISSP